MSDLQDEVRRAVLESRAVAMASAEDALALADLFVRLTAVQEQVVDEINTKVIDPALADVRRQRDSARGQDQLFHGPAPDGPYETFWRRQNPGLVALLERSDG